MTSLNFIIVGVSPQTSLVAEYLQSQGHRVEKYSRVFTGASRLFWGGIDALLIIHNPEKFCELLELKEVHRSLDNTAPILLISELNVLESCVKGSGINEVIHYTKQDLDLLMSHIKVCIQRSVTKSVETGPLSTKSGDFALVFSKIATSCTTLANITQEIILQDG